MRAPPVVNMMCVIVNHIWLQVCLFYFGAWCVKVVVACSFVAGMPPHILLHSMMRFMSTSIMSSTSNGFIVWGVSWDIMALVRF